MDCWEILGIEPTTDKKIIQKAYADLTKKYHYEVYPEEFKKIQEAYKIAISYTKNKVERNIYEPDYKLNDNKEEKKENLKSEFNFHFIDDYNKELEKLKNEFNYIYYDHNTKNRLIQFIFSDRFIKYINTIYNFDELFKNFFLSFSKELDYLSLKEIYNAFLKVFKSNRIDNKISYNILNVVSEQMKNLNTQRKINISIGIVGFLFVSLILSLYVFIQFNDIKNSTKKDFPEPKKEFLNEQKKQEIKEGFERLNEQRKKDIEREIWNFYVTKYRISFDITYNGIKEDGEKVEYYEFIVKPNEEDINKKVVSEFSVFEEVSLFDEEIVDTDEFLRNILATAAGRADILKKIKWKDRYKYNENHILMSYNYDEDEFIQKYQIFVDIVQNSLILDGTVIETEIFISEYLEQGFNYSFVKGEPFNLENFKESIKNLK